MGYRGFMADFTGSTHVDVDPELLFDYLSDVANLPRYFPRMTQASPGEGEKVHTAARMPDGHEVQADAWFRVMAEGKQLEWGSEGESNYHGSLEVTSVGGAAEVAEVVVNLHTERVEPGDAEVQDGIHETLANIKRLVEDSKGSDS